MITFFDFESSTNLNEIEELEFKLNLKLPLDYKENLLKYNGGRCTPNVFSFNENGKDTTSSIEWFLALYNGEYDNLLDYINTYKVEDKRMPIHIIPIANDGLGNCICISCGEKDYGYVYFWDHERELDWDSTNDYDYINLYFIAKSFTEFINSLREFEE